MHVLELVYEREQGVVYKAGETQKACHPIPEHSGWITSGEKDLWAEQSEKGHRLARLRDSCLSSPHEQDGKETQPLSLQLEDSGLFWRVFWKSEHSGGRGVRPEL